MSHNRSMMQACIEILQEARDIAYAQRRSIILDPRAMLRQNQAVQNFIRDLPPEEDACRTSPEIAPLQWDWVLTEAGWRLTRLVAEDRRRSRPPPEPTPPGVTEVVQRAAAIRRRFVSIVNGLGPAPDDLALMRAHLFGDRAPNLSRADLEADYDLMIIAAESLENPPAPIVAFLPTVKEMRKELHRVRPLKAGPKPKEPAGPWSEETVREAWLVHVAHSKVYSWVLAKAKDERTIARAERVFVGSSSSQRTQSSSSSAGAGTESSKTEEQAPAEGEGAAPAEAAPQQPSPPPAAESAPAPAEPSLPPEMTAPLPPGERNGHDRRPRG